MQTIKVLISFMYSPRKACLENTAGAFKPVQEVNTAVKNIKQISVPVPHCLFAASSKNGKFTMLTVTDLTNTTTGVIPGALVLTISSLSDDIEGLKLCRVVVNVRGVYVYPAWGWSGL